MDEEFKQAPVSLILEMVEKEQAAAEEEARIQARTAHFRGQVTHAYGNPRGGLTETQQSFIGAFEKKLTNPGGYGPYRPRGFSISTEGRNPRSR